MKCYPIKSGMHTVGYATLEKQGAQCVISCKVSEPEGEVRMVCGDTAVLLGRVYPQGDGGCLVKRVSAKSVEKTSPEFIICKRESLDDRISSVSYLRYARFDPDHKRVIYFGR